MTTEQVSATQFAANPAPVTSHSTVATTPAIPAGAVLTQVGSVLGGVLLLILFAAWLVRRLGFAPHARNSKLINVRASCQVGQRERVVIVEVNDTWLVLGVTAQQITPLHTLPCPPIDEATTSASNQPADFRQSLQKILQRREKST